MLKKILELDLPKEVFINFENPEKFYHAVGTCSERLKISSKFFDVSLSQMLKNKKILRLKLSKRMQHKILNFVLNIPSDYYRFLKPRNLEN